MKISLVVRIVVSTASTPIRRSQAARSQYPKIHHLNYLTYLPPDSLFYKLYFGFVPVPNIYNGLGGDYPEKTAFDLLTDMHSSNHGGVYANMPSGTTETDRDPVKIKRMLLGGLDAAFAFNAVGMMTPGYRNAIVLNTRSADNAFDFSTINNIMNGFVSPQVGYFSGVVDYYGPISPIANHTPFVRVWL